MRKSFKIRITMKVRFYVSKSSDGWIAESRLRYRNKKVLIVAEGDTFEDLLKDIYEALYAYFGRKNVKTVKTELIMNLPEYNS